MKLILMTSIESGYDAQNFAEIGFSAYFLKPATESDLYNSINVVYDTTQVIRRGKAAEHSVSAEYADVFDKVEQMRNWV